MRKVLLLLLMVIMLSGCSVKRVDKYDYKQILTKVLQLDVKLSNKVGNGYKYYAPKGVVRLDSKMYNDVLKSQNRIYYLYVDVVSYYYKTDIDYKVSNKNYYSALINYKDKTGYIDIKKIKDKLYIQMVYNYAKIETYVKEDELNSAILDLSYILSSVEFNDSLLKKMYESGSLEAKEEVYKLFEDKGREGNFLEFIKKYDKYDGSEENIEPEEEIKVKDTTTTSTKTTKEETTTTTTKKEETTTVSTTTSSQ